MQRRNKVGGILDRRFGENDPTMAPEDKMLERFAREKQRAHKKMSMFDLEDDEPMEGLTHGGKSLTFDDDDAVDDFDEDDLDGYDSDGSVRERQRLDRLRSLAETEGDEVDDGQPERKKSKKEVMEEIIAKSKHYKYERQAAKEDDTEMRAKLDSELQDIQLLLSKNPKKQSGPGDQASAIAGVERADFDRNFDMQVKKLAQDRRAQPSDRTKTEEEKIEEESKRLRELEEKRQKRMRGEEVSDSDEDSGDDAKADGENDAEDEEDDGFGLGGGIRAKPTATDMGLDDEDDFIIDDDLVASGSDVELLDSDDASANSDDEESASGEEEEEDDGFTKGLLNEEEAKNPVFQAASATKSEAIEKGDEHGLPFTFPCPQSYDELLSITSKYSHENTPKIVQRIRALYHPKLDSQNKERLGNFARALVDFVAAPWDATASPPFSVLESVVRHIHSLAKMFPIEISKQCRMHLEEMGEDRPLHLLPSDMVLLTAIGTIFPTSDHFHQVVTPAMLTIGRYLGQKVPQGLADYASGTYLSILSLQYQQLSKRYVPEVLNFSINTIYSLAPAAVSSPVGSAPIHETPAGCRIGNSKAANVRKLGFSDCAKSDLTPKQTADLQVSILNTTLQVLDAAADLWTGKPAFAETFAQAMAVAKHLNSKSCRGRLPTAVHERSDKLAAKLERMMRLAQLSRRPLELHHHRPLAIKTFIPKFEETYDPDKHYDHDRERAELAKLKKEHKRERKGAMRELRKDANFMARENLRVKKAKDEAYEKKFKRLVAEIQSEEGKESNEYERERKARKRARNR